MYAKFKDLGEKAPAPSPAPTHAPAPSNTTREHYTGNMDVAGARSAPIPIPASNRVHAVSAPGTDIVLELTSIEQKRQVLQTNRVVVIDIYGDWCGPCKQVAPKYAQLAAKYNRLGHCLLVKENVKNDPPLSQNIRGVPCFHFFLDGNLVDTITGGNITAVEQKVQELCSA